MHISAARMGRVVSSVAVLALLMGLLAAFQAARPQAARASVSAGDIIFTRSVFAKCPNNTQIAQLKSDGKVTDLSDCQTADQMPAVSPDGSKIAYQSFGHVNASGSDEFTLDGLYVMNSNGTGRIQVTQDYASNNRLNPCPCYTDENPAWNPLGTQLVFSRQLSASGYDIEKINSDGSGLTTLVNDTTSGSFVLTGGAGSWSPNGTEIAYTHMPAHGSPDIYVMNADGSNQHEVANAGYDPTWSPDGKKIYFDNGFDIFGVNADGSDLTQLTNSSEYGGTAYEPSVSPDGSTIVYSDNGQLYTISASANMQAGTPLASGPDSNEPTYAWATWPNASTKTIVALGDSVAAGEGINYGFMWTGKGWKRTGPSNPAWTDTTPALGANYQQCHQSGHGYPNLIALNGGNYQVYNMACTGASALQNNTSGKPEDGGVLDAERFDTNSQPYPQTGYTEILPAKQDLKKTVPAQLGGSCTGCDAFNTHFGNHNPSVVLLTTGANDLNFGYWLYTCYNPADGACNTTANTNLLNSQLSIEKSDLATALSQLNAWAAGKGKTLRVLVTNYYNPFNPNNTSCIDYNPNPIIGVGITGSELTWLENGLTNLNANIATDVTNAKASDTHLAVNLVDLSNVMSGHQWCSKNPWVYGGSIGYFYPQNPAPFHPTPQGQDAIYQTVNAVLNSPA